VTETSSQKNQESGFSRGKGTIKLLVQGTYTGDTDKERQSRCKQIKSEKVRRVIEPKKTPGVVKKVRRKEYQWGNWGGRLEGKATEKKEKGKPGSLKRHRGHRASGVKSLRKKEADDRWGGEI